MPQPRRYETGAQRQAAYRGRMDRARAAQLAQRGLPAMPAIPSIPGEKRWQTALQQTHVTLQGVCEEMRTYYTERTEQWQESERGEWFEERLQSLEELAEGVLEICRDRPCT